MNKRDIKKKGLGEAFLSFVHMFCFGEKEQTDILSPRRPTKTRKDIAEGIDELAGEALRELAKR